MQITFDPLNPAERAAVEAIFDGLFIDDGANGRLTAEAPVNTAPMAEALKRRRGRKAQATAITTVNPDVLPGSIGAASVEVTLGKEPEEIVIPKAEAAPASTSVSTDISGQQDLASILPATGAVLPIVTPEQASKAVFVAVPGHAPAVEVPPSPKPLTIDDVRTAYRAMHDVIGSDKANKALLGALSHHGAANLSALAAEHYAEVIGRFAELTAAPTTPAALS